MSGPIRPQLKHITTTFTRVLHAPKTSMSHVELNAIAALHRHSISTPVCRPSLVARGSKSESDINKHVIGARFSSTIFDTTEGTGIHNFLWARFHSVACVNGELQIYGRPPLTMEPVVAATLDQAEGAEDEKAMNQGLLDKYRRELLLYRTYQVATWG
ncbi:hypothetical protein M501DRAFT_1016416 [Patellaria atrata CBS 101060]|uniref:Uncharacterized protein n=1 Tax=Patellaria atrata CBS 101060 TaxID=1346257 RepID=A0A9P4VRY9_9PEZI|nr:hypothetical protein M501DRAFT_1016416 [Patellaria atrata CBS 101060]